MTCKLSMTKNLTFITSHWTGNKRSDISGFIVDKNRVWQLCFSKCKADCTRGNSLICVFVSARELPTCNHTKISHVHHNVFFSHTFKIIVCDHSFARIAAEWHRDCDWQTLNVFHVLKITSLFGSVYLETQGAGAQTCACVVWANCKCEGFLYNESIKFGK